MTNPTKTKEYDKLKETAAKLKASTNNEAKKSADKSKKDALAKANTNSISGLGASAEALAYLKAKAQKNRGIDADDTGGNLPMLTLIQNSDSSVDLPEGVEPKGGWFYYKPTKEMIQNPIVNIVYVKQCKLTSEYNKKITRDKSHYLIAGLLDGTNKPFVMYIKGVSYGEVWELFNQTRPWRKHKSNPIPMYSFKIKLSSGKKETDFGKKLAVFYEMLTQDNGIPMIVGDVSRLELLDQAVDSSERMVEGIIEKNIRDYGGDDSQLNDDADEVLTPKAQEAVVVDATQEDDDIPF